MLDQDGLSGTTPAHSWITAKARPALRKLVAAETTKETTTSTCGTLYGCCRTISPLNTLPVMNSRSGGDTFFQGFQLVRRLCLLRLPLRHLRLQGGQLLLVVGIAPFYPP